MKFAKFIFLSMIIISLASCVKETGSVELSYKKATAIYGDIDDIRSMPTNAQPSEVENPGKIFVGNDFILIGEEEKGIHVVDNTDPASPVFINFINVPGNREFYVHDHHIYAESYYDLLKIDINDLRHAKVVSRLEHLFVQPLQNEQGEELLGFSFEDVTEVVDINSDVYRSVTEHSIAYVDFQRNIIPVSAVPTSFAGNSNATSGTVNRIAYQDQHIYIINNYRIKVIQELEDQLIDLNVPDRITRGNDLETVIPYGDALFVGSRTAMDIVDISNPARPEYLYHFSHARSCDPVLPTDGVAYITLRTGDFTECPGNTNALLTLDITNLNAPVQTDEVVMYSPYGMTLIDDQLYVAEGVNGFSIFDVTDRTQPILSVQIKDIEAYDIIQHPSDADLLLIAGPDGIKQFNGRSTHSYSLTSNIGY